MLQDMNPRTPKTHRIMPQTRRRGNRRYRALVYWFAVLMVAVFGTIAADGLHKGAGIPYVVSTVFFALAVAVIFFVWHRSEGTLSTHSITPSPARPSTGPRCWPPSRSGLPPAT